MGQLVTPDGLPCQCCGMAPSGTPIAPDLASAVSDVCRRMEGSGVFEAGYWARVLRKTIAEYEREPA